MARRLTARRPAPLVLHQRLPFFTTEYNNCGLIVAIGWTGSGLAIERNENGPVKIRAGMELTHLVLHPGERIRTPRMLVMAWEDDRANAQNQFRRLMLLRSPQEQGRPVRLPVALQTFDRYNARPNGPARTAGEGVDTPMNSAATPIGLTRHGFQNISRTAWQLVCRSERVSARLKPSGIAATNTG